MSKETKTCCLETSASFLFGNFDILNFGTVCFVFQENWKNKTYSGTIF